MKKIILYCDCCGEETELEPLRLETGISFNGCEHEADYETVDLCGKCARETLYIFLPDDKYKEFLEYIRVNKRSRLKAN